MLNRFNIAVPTGLEMIRGNILFYPYFVPRDDIIILPDNIDKEL